MMNIFRRGRAGSPSLELPKICLPRQKRTTSVDEPKDIKCLEVPLEQRGRSSSFDSSSLHAEKENLEVPKPGKRCHSFDSCAPGDERSWSISSERNLSDSGKDVRRKSFKLSRYQKHRPSIEIPKLCIHCVYVESANKEEDKQECGKFYLGNEGEETLFSSSTSFSSSDEDFSDCSYDTDTDEEEIENGAIYINTNGHGDEVNLSSNEKTFAYSENLYFADEDYIETSPAGNDSSIDCPNDDTDGDYTNALTLKVPVIRQQRSTSFDGCLCKGSTSDNVSNPVRPMVKRQTSFDDDFLDVSKQIRSSSVDVNLPTDEETRYKAITTSPSHT